MFWVENPTLVNRLICGLLVLSSLLCYLDNFLSTIQFPRSYFWVSIYLIVSFSVDLIGLKFWHALLLEIKSSTYIIPPDDKVSDATKDIIRLVTTVIFIFRLCQEHFQLIFFAFQQPSGSRSNQKAYSRASSRQSFKCSF